jgi:ArsR family transcriptional regulator
METLMRRTVKTTLPRADGCCAVVVQPVLDSDRVALAARRFKALADPTRLTILTTLAVNDEPICACDLGDDVELEQPTVAHHLKVLRDAGLVTTERRGKWAYYSLHPEAAAWVRATVAALP